jgi:hypothetical protein
LKINYKTIWRTWPLSKCLPINNICCLKLTRVTWLWYNISRYLCSVCVSSFIKTKSMHVWSWTLFEKHRYCRHRHVHITGAGCTDHPPFSNFLFTNLFSMKFLYFFIISSFFPYFNLLVLIFIHWHEQVTIYLKINPLFV